MIINEIIEGLPSNDYIYLIGLVIVNGKSLIKKSFWADNSSKEDLICFNYIDYVSTFSNFTICHYGNYEIKYLRYLTLNRLADK